MKTHQQSASTAAVVHRRAQQPFFTVASRSASGSSQAVQTKLAVSQPGDQHEIEAERMADFVSERMHSPFFGAGSSGVSESAPAVSRLGAEATEADLTGQEPGVQRMAHPWLSDDAESGEADAPPPAAIQRSADEAGDEIEGREEEEERLEPIQTCSRAHSRSAPATRSRRLATSRLTSCRPLSSSLRPSLSRSLIPNATSSVAARIHPSRARGPPGVGSRFESRLARTKGGGDPLPERSRTRMESAFGADFGEVRVHTSRRAAGLANNVNAHAFTHGRDIYFNRGQFAPDSPGGQRLLAHELTHVVQQGAAVQTRQISRACGACCGCGNCSRAPPERLDRSAASRPPSLSRAPPSVQCLGWDDIKERVNGYAENIPGFTLATVIAGYNPILGRNVEWSARNFFRGAAGLIPFGTRVYDMLAEAGVVDAVFGWIETKTAQYNLTYSRLSGLFDQAWEEMDFLTLSPIDHNVAVVRRVFGPFLGDVASFAGDAVAEFVRILKELAQKAFRAVIGSDGPAYDLIAMILGKDPLTGDPVAWETAGFLRSVLQIFGFDNHLAKLEETGKLQEAAAWIDAQVGLLVSAFTGLIGGIKDIWSNLDLAKLVRPDKLLGDTLNVALTFVGKLLTFAGNVASKVLEIIKDAILWLLKTHLHGKRGYALFTVVLGQDPVTGEAVPRTAANFIKGFLEFSDKGTELYEQLVEGNAIGKAMDWLKAQVQELGLTPAAIAERFLALWESFSIDDLMNPLGAFERVAGTFLGFVGDILTLAGRIGFQLLKILFEVVMGGGRVMAIIEQAGDAFRTIVEDPIGFIGNLIGAVKQGFSQFGANILEHLKTGLMGWLFGALEGAGIQLPESFDLKGILSLALQVLGLTYRQIRPKLVRHLGEAAVGHLETAFEVVRILVTEGIAGVWERITEFLTVSLPEMVIGAIKGFVIEKIVKSAIVKLASMLNPAGAVVQAIIAIYNTVMFFIERWNQIVSLAESVVNSISRIANGQIAAAANFVEQSMARTLPVIISFLARLLGLGGISEKIKEIIAKVQEPVGKAVDKVIGWIVKQAKKLGNKLFGDRENPQSTAVKDEAKQLLVQRIGSEASVDEVNQAIPQVMNQLRPKGLKSLSIGLDPRNEGNYVVTATASDPKNLLTLVASEMAGRKVTVALHANLVFKESTTLVETEERSYPGLGTRDVASPGQGAVQSGDLGALDHEFEDEEAAALGERFGSFAHLDPNRESQRWRGPYRDRRRLRRESRPAGGVARPGSESSTHDVMTWNAGGRYDTGECHNTSHAENALLGFVERMDPKKRRLIRELNVHLSHTPCALCSGTLASVARVVKASSSDAVLSLAWDEKWGPKAGSACFETLNPTTAAIEGWGGAFGPLPAGAAGEESQSEEEELKVQQKPISRFASSDPLETEADRVADFVTGAAAARPSRISPRRDGPSCKRRRTGGETTSGVGRAHRWIDRTTTRGSALPGKLRADIQPVLGADLSAVRVHTGPDAAGLSNRLQARAFTHGNDIYFNRGEYDPSSRSGRHLLAHELTHVVQQRGGQAPRSIQRAPASPSVDSSMAPAGGGSEVLDFTLPDGTHIDRVPKVRGSGANAVAKKSIELPAISLPRFKRRNHKRFRGVLALRGGPRQDSAQRETWRESVRASVTRKLAPLLKQAEGKGAHRAGEGIYYLKSERQGSDFHLIGTRDEVMAHAALPFWDRFTRPTSFEVDHILEDQLVNDQDPSLSEFTSVQHASNYELLESLANSSSGSSLSAEVTRRLNAAVTLSVKHAERFNQDSANAGKFIRPLTEGGLRHGYHVNFLSHSFDLATGSGDPDRYWSHRDILQGLHLNLLRPLTPREMRRLGSPTSPVIFTAPQGGRALPVPAAEQLPIENWLPRVDLLSVEMAEHPGEGDTAGWIQVAGYKAEEARAGGIVSSYPNMRWRLRTIPGVFGGALDDSQVKTEFGNAQRSLMLPGLSPVRIDAAGIGANGIHAEGAVLPTLPFFGGAGIPIVIDGDRLAIRKSFALGDLHVPSPLDLYDGTLEVFWGSRGLGAAGTIRFGVKHVGEGTLTAVVDRMGRFALDGRFTFDKRLFSRAEVAVSYKDGQWGLAGTIGIGKGKVRGLKSAELTVGYAQNTLSASGGVEFDIPGIQAGKLDLLLGAEGFRLGAGFTLGTGLPRIKSGSGEVTVSKPAGAEDYSVTARGTATADLPGIDPALTIDYANGALTVEVSGKYRFGKLEGDLHFAVTNREIGDDGKPTDKASDRFTAFGSGTARLKLTEAATGEVQLKVYPDGRLTLAGGLSLAQNLPLLKKPYTIGPKSLGSLPSGSITIWGASVFGKKLGIFLTYGGGVSFYLSVGPPVLETAQLDLAEIEPGQLDQASLTGKAKLNLPALAYLKAELRLGLEGNLVILKVGGMLIPYAKLQLEGNVGGEVSLAWSAARGLELLDAKGHLSGSAAVIFGLDAEVYAKLDLLLKTITVYRDRFNLAQKKLGISFDLGVDFPVKLQDGTFKPFGLGEATIKDPISGKDPQELLKTGYDEAQNPPPPPPSKEEALKLVRVLPSGPGLFVGKGFLKDVAKLLNRESYHLWLVNTYPDMEWGFVRTEMHRLDRLDFERLRAELAAMKAERAGLISAEDLKMMLISDFQDDHPMFSRARLQELRRQVRSGEV